MRRFVTCLIAVALACIGGGRASAGSGPEEWRIGEAYKLVTGREPEAEHHKSLHYTSWSSFGDLCNKVRARWTRQGAAYVFIKPSQAGRQGHIGWGVMADDGTYLCGSTENPNEKDNVARAVYIPPGDPKGNGFWWKFCTTEQEMLDTMASTTPEGTAGPSGYWHYKTTAVMNRDFNAAHNAAVACRDGGFHGIGNNCLDQTMKVLQAYGTGLSDTNWGRVLPVINAPLTVLDVRISNVPFFSKITPNDWFNSFGRIENGVATNGSGYGTPLPGVGSSLISFPTVGSWWGMDEKALTADPREPGMIRLQPWDHEPHQQWYFNPDEKNPGWYFISNRAANRNAKGEWLVLDVPNGSSDPVYLTCISG